MYFTPRYPTKENSQRACRTAGCGVWLGCSKDKHIKVRSRLIGHKTQLTFVIIKGRTRRRRSTQAGSCTSSGCNHPLLQVQTKPSLMTWSSAGFTLRRTATATTSVGNMQVLLQILVPFLLPNSKKKRKQREGWSKGDDLRKMD